MPDRRGFCLETIIANFNKNYHGNFLYRISTEFFNFLARIFKFKAQESYFKFKFWIFRSIEMKLGSKVSKFESKIFKKSLKI